MPSEEKPCPLNCPAGRGAYLGQQGSAWQPDRLEQERRQQKGRKESGGGFSASQVGFDQI